jgi:hypothetical protein
MIKKTGLRNLDNPIEFSCAGKNPQGDPHPRFPGEVVGERFVPLELFEYVLLRDQPDS